MQNSIQPAAGRIVHCVDTASTKGCQRDMAERLMNK
jgi:hypothetical protein